MRDEETLENGLVEAVEKGDWKRARHLAAIKVAQMMEKTESPREVKALSISLENLIEVCDKEDVTDNMANSEVGQILANIRARAAADGKTIPRGRRYHEDG